MSIPRPPPSANHHAPLVVTADDRIAVFSHERRFNEVLAPPELANVIAAPAYLDAVRHINSAMNWTPQFSDLPQKAKLLVVAAAICCVIGIILIVPVRMKAGAKSDSATLAIGIVFFCCTLPCWLGYQKIRTQMISDHLTQAFSGISAQLAAQSSTQRGQPNWTLELKPLPVKESTASKVGKAVATGAAVVLVVGLSLLGGGGSGNIGNSGPQHEWELAVTFSLGSAAHYQMANPNQPLNFNPPPYNPAAVPQQPYQPYPQPATATYGTHSQV